MSSKSYCFLDLEYVQPKICKSAPLLVKWSVKPTVCLKLNIMCSTYKISDKRLRGNDYFCYASKTKIRYSINLSIEVLYGLQLWSSLPVKAGLQSCSPPDFEDDSNLISCNDQCSEFSWELQLWQQLNLQPFNLQKFKVPHCANFLITYYPLKRLTVCSWCF